MRSELLLHPQIPKPLHGLNPRTILGKEWWDSVRKEAYRKECYHCHACGVFEEDAKYFQHLEAHECYVIDYQAGTAEMIEVVALCHSCHSYIHKGRMKHLLVDGRLSAEKYEDIIQSRNKILQKAGMFDNPFTKNHGGPYPDWTEWRLVLEGKEYKPLFNSMDEWIEHYIQ